MKRKGFKSFVLKVCETKGVADAFLVKCVKRKSLGGILSSFQVLTGAAVSSGSLAATLHPPLAGSGQGGVWRLRQKYV